MVKKGEKMYYVQYFTADNSRLIEACVDRGVVILDGRNSLTTMIEDAKFFNANRRPRYAAFQIRKGFFSRSRHLTPIMEV